MTFSGSPEGRTVTVLQLRRNSLLFAFHQLLARSYHLDHSLFTYFVNWQRRLLKKFLFSFYFLSYVSPSSRFTLGHDLTPPFFNIFFCFPYTIQSSILLVGVLTPSRFLFDSYYFCILSII